MCVTFLSDVIVLFRGELVNFLLVYFFFKQKTAYEMRISDLSSDVCSSDLTTLAEDVAVVADQDHEEAMVKGAVRTDFILSAEIMVIALNEEIGRASCRERVCQYV